MRLFIFILGFTFCVATANAQTETNPPAIHRAQKTQVVETACGECQFHMKGKGCHLAVKIDGKPYFVDGTTIDDHGDAHDANGFCNAVRKAEVTGNVVNDRFVATSFKLLPVEKKNSNMTVNTFRLATTDEHQTPMYAWLPEITPDAVLHIVHGMAEYAERYAPIAQKLVEKGFAVYANDNRAHGNDVAEKDLGIGEANWFYKQVEDIRYIIQFLRKQHPGKKIFLLGHSMGSFLCQRYFQLYGKEIDGLILSASNGQQDPLMGIGIGVALLQYKIMGKSYRSALIDSLSFGQFNKAFKPNRTPNDWLSRDEKEVDKYVADKRCGFVCSAGFFYYFFKGIKDAFAQKNIASIPANVPVYCFAGDKDPVGLKGKGFLKLIENWKAAGAKDIHYDLYENGRHEMLNEINRDEVIGNLISWMKIQMV